MKLASREVASFEGKMAAFEGVMNGITLVFGIIDLVTSFFPQEDPFSNENIYKLDVDIYNLERQVNQTVTEILDRTGQILVRCVLLTKY